MERSVQMGFTTTVDSIYDNMTEGQRQHMANKLYKHGYESPKAANYVEPVKPWFDQIAEWRENGITLDGIARAYFKTYERRQTPRGKE